MNTATTTLDSSSGYIGRNPISTGGDGTNSLPIGQAYAWQHYYTAIITGQAKPRPDEATELAAAQTQKQADYYHDLITGERAPRPADNPAHDPCACICPADASETATTQPAITE